MAETVIIVPARLASVRYPRKLLHPVAGKPILLWTAERIRAEAPEFPLYFAVAETELAEVLAEQGFQSVMTDPALPSGTDRLAEANRSIGAARVINVQADEPMVTGGQIRTLAALLDNGADLATLCTPFRREEEFRDPNKVKVVRGYTGEALYFSRAPIPFVRDGMPFGSYPAFWHLGLYAYTAQFLSDFRQLPPGELEQLEKLEQLRALENGRRIAVGITDQSNIGIDTPADADDFARHMGRL